MTKRLICATFIAMGLLLPSASFAKVCQLGDRNCDTSGFFASGDGKCGDNYSECEIPRVGAPYCARQESDGTYTNLYTNENCCKYLADNAGYKICNADDNEIGFGKSCLGTNNIRYWQSCGCSYGFVSTNGDSLTAEITDITGQQEIPFNLRCSYYETGSGADCQFAVCNNNRRWFFEETGSHCIYRNATRCGGFACMQLFDCDHENWWTGGNEFYRNSSLTLSDADNFISYNESDPWSNERLSNGNIARIENINPFLSSQYNLTDKYVCGYEGYDGHPEYDDSVSGGGYSCNDIQNYCYKWTGCNTTRGWFGSSTEFPVNAGIIYMTASAGSLWRREVEERTDYSPYTYGEGGLRGTGLDLIPNNITLRNNFLAVAGPGFNPSISGSDYPGCVYVKQKCHQSRRDHQCWKRIGCTHDYSYSFINAAQESLYNASLNAPYVENIGSLADNLLLYKGMINGEGIVNWDAPEKYIAPACKYKINACNDTENGGNNGGGCYKFIGCAEGFTELEIPELGEWSDWFIDLRPMCNNGQRCYKASGCNEGAGSYAVVPNTSFFVTAYSSYSEIECYRGIGCNEPAGAYDNASKPNTSFFFVIDSSASGSTCYRGQECHFAAGAYDYASQPNTEFFVTSTSVASGSTCYRGISCQPDELGIHETSPNEDFFAVVSSQASGSTCYRSEGCADEAYSESPNTSFFVVEESTDLGSTCYRGAECHFEAGAYDYASKPNAEFFVTINSSASGVTCYRGESCNIEDGAYEASPNTSFFITAKSVASGSECYRANSVHEAVGAYDQVSKPNIRFFVTVSSSASGISSYRAVSVNDPAGAIEETPDSSFFVIARSEGSGLVAYRADECNEVEGAYSIKPDEQYFRSISSEGTFLDVTVPLGESITGTGGELSGGRGGSIGGSIGGDLGRDKPFNPINPVVNVHEQHDAPICYRATACADDRQYGFTVPSIPDTSFFLYTGSTATGINCYRISGCNTAAGAISDGSRQPPDLHHTTSAFVVITDPVTINTSFFHKTVKSYSENAPESSGLGSGKQICRWVIINGVRTRLCETIAVFRDTYLWRCARGDSCAMDAGAYSVVPNLNFFNTISSISPSNSRCYRAESCMDLAQADEPSAEFFVYSMSQASGSTCYRTAGCVDDAYLDEPNTQFFITDSSEAVSFTCYRGRSCNYPGGAYDETSQPNTQFFITVMSQASGSTCYRGVECNEAAGAVPTAPEGFVVDSSSASGIICYRSSGCDEDSGTYSESPNTSFFSVDTYPQVNGSACYRATACHTEAGAYDEASKPSTSYFITIDSVAAELTCYRAEECNENAGAFAAQPNSNYFIISEKKASGSTCYRTNGCNEAAGAYEKSSQPSTEYFKLQSSTGSGVWNEETGEWDEQEICYRATACNTTLAYTRSEEPNSEFFVYRTSQATGTTCYRITGCNLESGVMMYNTINGGLINSSFFEVVSQNAGQEGTCVQQCIGGGVIGPVVPGPGIIGRTNAGQDVTIEPKGGGGLIGNCPNACGIIGCQRCAFLPPIICAKATGCATSRGAYSNEPNTNFFNTISSTSTTISICYRGESCATDRGAYDQDSKPNTLFFNTVASAASGINCYRATRCNKRGSYSISPNTNIFLTVSSTASDLTCYRASACNTEAGILDEYPDTSGRFFHFRQDKSGNVTCYRATACYTEGGAYSNEPNTLFFNTAHSTIFSSTCYRGTSCNTAAGAYNSISTEYFTTISSKASGSTCYRATGCAEGTIDGSSIGSLNNSYFDGTSQTITNITCYRLNCNYAAGAYSTAPNTNFFNVDSQTNGSTCYRATECAIGRGAYSDEPNTLFFNTVDSTATSITCYRSTSCATSRGAYSDEPNTSFFKTNYSKSSGSKCYRARKCNDAGGAYDEASQPNTEFFKVISSKSSGSKCYRARKCNDTGGAYTSSILTEANQAIFTFSRSLASGSECYRATGCKDNGSGSTCSANTTYFSVTNTTGETHTLGSQTCTTGGNSELSCQPGYGPMDWIGEPFHTYGGVWGKYCHNPDDTGEESVICRRLECKAPNYELTGDCLNTSYFKIISSASAYNYSTTDTTTPTEEITCGKVKVDDCAFTQDDINVGNGETLYYTFESQGKKCEGYRPDALYKPNGCNTDHGSYASSSTNTNIIGTDGNSYAFNDVFEEGFLAECYPCITTCTCRQGWTSGNAPANNGNSYVTVTTTKSYANGNPDNPQRVSCYKAVEPVCTDGYFYSATEPSTPTGYSYDIDPNVDNCYKIKCATGYVEESDPNAGTCKEPYNGLTCCELAEECYFLVKDIESTSSGLRYSVDASNAQNRDTELTFSFIKASQQDGASWNYTPAGPCHPHASDQNCEGGTWDGVEWHGMGYEWSAPVQLSYILEDEDEHAFGVSNKYYRPTYNEGTGSHYGWSNELYTGTRYYGENNDGDDVYTSEEINGHSYSGYQICKMREVRGEAGVSECTDVCSACDECPSDPSDVSYLGCIEQNCQGGCEQCIKDYWEDDIICHGTGSALNEQLSLDLYYNGYTNMQINANTINGTVNEYTNIPQNMIGANIKYVPYDIVILKKEGRCTIKYETKDFATGEAVTKDAIDWTEYYAD